MSPYRLTVSGVAVMAMWSVAWTAPASAQGNCDWYAATAIKQQQRNERQKCGLSGSGWSSDKGSHMEWCANAAPDEWKRAAQQREQQLTACANK